LAALKKFSDLPAKERVRFATILNDTIAAMYSGVVFSAARYDRGRPEADYMRQATRQLRKSERARDAEAAGGMSHG
jgi:hypothetical protein